MEEVLRLPAVLQRSGLRKTSVYAAVKRGAFPAPIRIGDRAVGWLASEVEAWLRERAAASRVRHRPEKEVV